MQHSACFGQSFTLSKKRGGWKIQRPKPAQPFWKTTHNIHLQKDKVRLALMYTGRYWGNSIHNRSFKLSHFYALLWGRGQKCNSCRLPRDNSIFFGCRSLHPKYVYHRKQSGVNSTTAPGDWWQSAAKRAGRPALPTLSAIRSLPRLDCAAQATSWTCQQLPWVWCIHMCLLKQSMDMDIQV